MNQTVGRPKSEEKRKLILEAAKCQFLDKGINQVSMDLIAKEAGVSKQTVYSHFNNKETLYCEAVISKLHHYHLDTIESSEAQPPLEDVLRDIATKFIDLLHDPQVIAMYRLLIGDVCGSNRINELFLQSGPKKLMGILADFLVARLNVSEQTANLQSLVFFNILKGDYLLRGLLGLDNSISEQDKETLIQTAIEVVDQLNHRAQTVNDE